MDNDRAGESFVGSADVLACILAYSLHAQLSWEGGGLLSLPPSKFLYIHFVDYCALLK